MKQKLELTWIVKENRPKLEPRILLEVPAKSTPSAVSPAPTFAVFFGLIRRATRFVCSDRGRVQTNLYEKVPTHLKAHVQARKCAQLYGADTVFY